MARDLSPLHFRSPEAEAAELNGPAGEGGRQLSHKRSIQELEDGNRTVTFNDAQLGELVRYMTQYGSGESKAASIAPSFDRWLNSLV